MTKPEIIGASRSTYTWAIRILCEEKAIDYTLIETAIRSAELRAIHPFAKMPVLRHGDVRLFESMAIAVYLDRAFPGPQFIPSEALPAALTEQWVSLVNTTIDRTLIRTYLFAYIATPDGKPNRAAIEAVLPEMGQQIAVLDSAVTKTGHLVGVQLTYADINLMPILYRIQHFPEGTAAMAEAPQLSAYYKRHAARPSFTRTIPPAGVPKTS